MGAIRAAVMLILLSGVAAAGEQMKSPRGELVDVADDHIQGALANGYVRVSAQEASDLATKRGPDEPAKFDWTLVLVGAAVATCVAGIRYATRARRA